MKRLRYVFLTIVILVCLYMTVNAADYTYTAPDGSYSLSLATQGSSMLRVTGFAETPTETIPELVIPAEVEGLTVTSIDSEAFKDCTVISSVVFPEGITSIFTSAFEGCTGLTGQLELPSTLTYISPSAFKDCSSLSGDLILPDGIQQLYYATFYGCTGLDGTLSLPVNLNTVESSAFYGCSGLTGTLEIPSSVTNISDRAFYNCSGFTSLVLPDTLTTIGMYAFQNCSGLSGALILPDSVTTLETYAFSGCSNLTSLKLSENLEWIKSSAFNLCTGLSGELIIPDSVKTIGTSAFYGCTNLQSVVFPDTLTSIGGDAFENCTGLSGQLDLPSALAKLGGNAFLNCSGLTGDLILPDGITTIEYRTFKGCTGLNGKLTLPAALETLKGNAFENCSGLTSVTFGDKLVSIGGGAFQGCSGLSGQLQLPESLTAIYGYAFYGCSSLSGDLTLPDSLTTLQKYAFYGCSGLNGNLTFGPNLTEIPEFAFNGCGFKGSLTLPETLMTIGNAAFISCPFTGDLTIPDTVTSIGFSAFRDSYPASSTPGRLILSQNISEIKSYTFQNCSGLTGQLIIPQGVTSIGTYAFQNATGFTGLYLSPGLKEINYCAFENCTGLTGDLTIPDTVTKLGEDVFFGCTGFDGDLILSQNLTEIPQRAFVNCKFTGPLELPAGLTALGAQAFAGCDGFTGRLVLPAGLSIIPERAFSNCSSLTGLTLAQGPCSIRDYVFENCTGFRGSLIIPYTITNVYDSAFFGCSGFSSIYLPTDTSNFVSSTVKVKPFEGCTGIMHVYYGGTEEDWNSQALRFGIGFGAGYVVHYESYTDTGIQIQGDAHSVQFGQTITLQATWGGVTPAVRSDFSWSVSDPALLTLVDSTCVIDTSGLSAHLTATFLSNAEGDATVTVYGPNSTSDSCTVSSTGNRSISYVPHAEQKDGEMLILPVGDAKTLTFRYITSGDLETDLQSIQWAADSTGLSLSNPAYEITDASSALLTASVNGVTAGDPVTVTVTGPDGCTASCKVIVIGDKITILYPNQTLPGEGEAAFYPVATGEEFTVYLQYESAESADVVKEKLKGMTWVQTTMDFMVHPDDRSGSGAVPVFRNSDKALTLEDISFDDKGGSPYLIKATFAAAQEGFCGLEARVGDYAYDRCMVQASFDNITYLAKLLHDSTNPTTVDVYEKLKGDTPATVMLDVLKEDGLFTPALLAWGSLELAFEGLEEPSALYNVNFKAEDLYYGMLLEVLSGTLDEGNDTRVQDALKFGNDMMDTIKDAFQMAYSSDFSQIDFVDVVLSDAGKQRVLKEAFQGHYKGINGASDLIEKLDLLGKGLDELQAIEDRATAAVMLQGVGEATETVLRQMLEESKDNAALYSAIQRCLEQVGATTAEMMENIKDGTLASVGSTSAKIIVDKLWKNVIDDVKTNCPQAAMAYVAYHSGTTLSNVLGATDATNEEYYKLVALQDIKAVTQTAHNSISAGWEENPAAYLASVQMLFQIQLLDCDHALHYVDVADDALLSKAINAIAGENSGFTRAEECFADFRNTIKVLNETYQIMWLDFVQADYPGVLLEAGYEEAFANIMKTTREALFACPVNVYVLDGETVIGYVADGTVHANAEDVTVTLEGDEKTITFLNGANYTLKVVGTGEGTMNVTDTRYDGEGNVSRVLEYNDLPVTTGGEYRSKRFNLLTDDGGETLSADSDSMQAAHYTLTMISGRADVTLARGGQNVPVMAVVPDGCTFAGWLCDNAEAVLADPESPVTTLRMPAGGVTLTAQLKVADAYVPEDCLTLTDEEGYILREITDTLITLRVANDSTCLLALYDTNGKLLSVHIPEAVNGLVSMRIDNTDGRIGRIALFRVESLANPVPTEKALEITAKE